MAEKSTRKATTQDVDASGPDRIRNVVLVGPSQSGKTSLVEALLAEAGAILRPGSVAEGTTVCDTEDAEQAHGRSISLAVAPVVHETSRSTSSTPLATSTSSARSAPGCVPPTVRSS